MCNVVRIVIPKDQILGSLNIYSGEAVKKLVCVRCILECHDASVDETSTAAISGEDHVFGAKLPSVAQWRVRREQMVFED